MWLHSIVGTRGRGVSGFVSLHSGPDCVRWFATGTCTPLGPREPAADLHCDAEVRGASGYCVCEGNVSVARMTCGAHRFRCRERCAALAHDPSPAQPLPEPLTCGPRPRLRDQAQAQAHLGPNATEALGPGPGGDGGLTAAGAGAEQAERRRWDVAGLDRQAASLWARVEAAMALHAIPPSVPLPPPRTLRSDWVAEGGHLPAAAVRQMGESLMSFLAAAPPYPHSNRNADPDLDLEQDPQLDPDPGGGAGRVEVGASAQGLEGASAGGRRLGSAARREEQGEAGAAAGGATGSHTQGAAVGWLLDQGRARIQWAGGWDGGRGAVRALAGLWGGGRAAAKPPSSPTPPPSPPRPPALPPAPPPEPPLPPAPPAPPPAPPHPPWPLFRGRGVVLLGGGRRELTAAWTSLHLLRGTGCALPVEVWFPEGLHPGRGAERALRARGAVVRVAPGAAGAGRGGRQGGGEPGGGGGGGAYGGGGVAGGLEVVAALLSSFKEVLLLAPHMLPLRDPTPLLASAPYAALGALAWTDLWAAAPAPGAQHALGVLRSQRPPAALQGGVVLVDKSRHWKGLVAAAWLSRHGAHWGPLLGGAVAPGEAQLLPYGLLAVGGRVWTQALPPAGAGLQVRLCAPMGPGAWLAGPWGRGACRTEFLATATVLLDTEGQPLFLRADQEAWALDLPASFERGWTRRWAELRGGAEGGAQGAAPATNVSAASLLATAERGAWAAQRRLACAPWFGAYADGRMRGGGEAPLRPLAGMHPLPPPLPLRERYREGWAGRYVGLLQPAPTWTEAAGAWWAQHVGWRLRPARRALCRLLAGGGRRALQCQ
ncbi:hypothetical protein HYH03_008212 [Edaphochlamys debaryana]|uniref:Uncharacterized protein n=1 Tax=Edaphochlamys debaryana TaxID=47281 RepID=A0A835Y0K6_9CHLO|nr:hypothetical protein HYH03_008212 [Edaphochlamys debaryana]|eukprot:KAG2493698.1 hypothetical protein HYH03_008212 [Edaphochlamys debaryana]